MTRTGVVIQARMSSERLPGKVLRPVGGRPMLGCLLDRLAHAEMVHEVVIATSDRPDDDPVAAFGAATGIAVYRGPLGGRAGAVRHRRAHRATWTTWCASPGTARCWTPRWWTSR